MILQQVSARMGLHQVNQSAKITYKN